MKQTTSHYRATLPRMINDDQKKKKYPIELMQQTSVNYIPLISSSSSSSSQIRLVRRCFDIFDHKQKHIFQQIFSFNEQIINICDEIFNQYITRLTKNSINTLILLVGQYCEINQIQQTLLSLTLKHLFEKESFLVYLTIEQYSSEKKSYLILRNCSIISPIQTCEYLQKICSIYQYYPLLITFSLRNHSTNVQFRLFSINQSDFIHSYDNHYSYILTTKPMDLKKKEIWVDGPLCKNEIWIDGPRTTPKHRSKPMYKKSKYPLRSSPTNLDDPNFDTESIVSSHCHLPVLPVFKDHSLLPFRHNQIKSIPPTPPKPTLKSNDLEKLEKTLENLLIPDMTKSLNRIEEISSQMTNDEKNKRLSRIVSPTRFDKLFSSENQAPSVPNSPCIQSKTRLSRKPQIPIRTSSLADARPSIFQRLFGLRSSLNSPPLSPLTVTLDSPDDHLGIPLTTSSTTSSSGRASSSGYESMSNMLVEDAHRSNSIRLRKKLPNSTKLTQLKHRQNELKLELAMTKTFLLMDQTSNVINCSPIRSPNCLEDEEELEKTIEILEKRLASAKLQLKKNKQLKT